MPVDATTVGEADGEADAVGAGDERERLAGLVRNPEK
jgi:hypothetical protein